MKKRQVFGKEFKAKVAIEALKGQRTAAGLLGVGLNAVVSASHKFLQKLRTIAY